jgi:hypothetical protein
MCSIIADFPVRIIKCMFLIVTMKQTLIEITCALYTLRETSDPSIFI